ncbi:glycosyltransferase family 4 protein [Patescibacteria group bacterium]|nr:glycosyltransferase family 4 protein [Patescibacteria group bacterium]
MKICIFHNLPQGGAFNYFLETSRYLSKDNELELFSFQDLKYPKYFKKLHILHLNKTKNIFSFTLQAIFELRQKEKIMAAIINKSCFDLIILHHCYITQSPYLLKFLKQKDKIIYILHEPKREFYESTSFDHNTLHKKISRLIRYPIKIIDLNNCSYAKNIICNSKYSQYIIKTVYKKQAKVIYPGLKYITKQPRTKTNNHTYVSIGLLSKIKGFEELISIFNKFKKEKLIIIGRSYIEGDHLLRQVNNKNIIIKQNIDDLEKKMILKNSTFYIANQQNEPFGLSTLEAANENCFLIGNNSGGTPEIIKNNVNGKLWPNNTLEKYKLIKNLSEIKCIKFFKITTIDWEYTTNQILKYGSKIKHEPEY